MPEAISPMVHSEADADASSPLSSPQLPSMSDQWSLADLQRHLGRVPLERIRLFPSPGAGTDRDVLERQDDRLCELNDYLSSGTSLVWYVDPVTRSATVHSPSRATRAAGTDPTATNARRVASDGVLTGDDVLPGLEISLADLFERAERGAGSARGSA